MKIDVKKEIQDIDSKSILFVCYGNTCRSPMAEGLAKKVLGDKVRVESAGLAPVFESACPEAVKLMKEDYDVDLSRHVPRNIVETPLRSFDRIVVLDSYVYKTLKKLVPDVEDKLLFWNIEDPFGKSMDVFQRVAERIWREIQNSLKENSFFL